MIEYDGEGSCVLDVGGVGYEVFVPLRNLSHLPLTEPATLHVHTHVREDALTLYGFMTAEDRTAFRSLLSVSGVGPKLALTVLSDLSAHDLYQVIARADRGRLERISGVGKKTAARLLLELKDKLAPGTAVAGTTTAAAQPIAAALGDLDSQACDALTNLGFTRAQAESALHKLGKQRDDLPLEQLLRRALATLG
jgi:holliday junction DNA helicase RuvA